jgi:hypothetical protein
MNSPLNGLTANPGPTAAAGAPPPATANASPTQPLPPDAPPSPNNFASAAANPKLRAPLAVLKAVAGGQLPGVLVPTDAPKLDSSITPQDLHTAGIGMYRPQTKGLALVLYDPQQVPVATLQAMDAAGKLNKAFPSITKLMDQFKSEDSGEKSEDSGSRKNVPETNAADTTDSRGPAGSPINDMNLTGAPAPTAPNMVPVLPKSSFSADAQKRLALARQSAIAGNVPPSARPIPGGGSLLNGLLQSPV